MYNFKVTVDPTGRLSIRIELVVLDKALSEKFRMYFVVVPEGFGDAEPEIQWDNLLLNASKYGQDTLTISGQVLSGAETNEVWRLILRRELLRILHHEVHHDAQWFVNERCYGR